MPKRRPPTTLPADVLDMDRDDRVSFRCPPVLRQAIEAHAKRDHRSVSDWLTIAVTEILNLREEKF